MATDLTQATINVRANTKAMERDILKSLRTIELSQIDTKKSSLALGRITGQVSEFNKSLEASNARVIAFGASAGAIFAVEKAISSLVTSTIEVEKSLADINVLLSLSSADLQKFSGSLFAVAKNTAQSFATVAEAATELSRQGLGVEETIKRTNAALILTRLSGLDAKSSVEALTATINSFSSSALDATVIVNKLANVDAAFAVSSADLANAISRVGSTAQDAGVSLDELIALVTSAQQTTARGGSVIGNSFKTIFTRLQRGKVKSLLSELGVDTSESQNAISLLNQLASVYEGLEATQKSAVAESVGGVFQINILKAALGDLGKQYSIYDKALSTSLGSTDQAIQRNKDLNQTVSALANQAYANLQQASSKIGQLVFEPNAKGLLNTVNNLLSSFNEIDVESAGGKFVQGFFKGIGNFIGGPGTVLATAVIAKLFTKLAQYSAGSLKEILGRNEASKQQLVVEQSVLGMLQRNADLNQKILSGKVSVAQAEKGILDLLSAESTVLREQERISSRIAANLMARGVSVRDGKPMVPKAASSGFVPNFASSMALGQAMENAGARDHGYRAGIARKTRIHDGSGKSFTSFVNSKEDVKTFTNAAGKKATIVRPPNGFGENTQYAAGGFVPNYAVIKGLAGKEGKYNSAANVKKTYQKDLIPGGTQPAFLAGRIFESLAQNEKYISLTEAETVADIQTGRYAISEAKLSGRAAYKDKNFGSGKLKGSRLLLPSSASDAYDKRLIENKRAEIQRAAGLSHPRLFSLARKMLDLDARGDYEKMKVSPSRIPIPLSAGFVPNFAKASDLYKRIKAGEGVTDPFNKEKNKKGNKKDLGSLPYTMAHGGAGGFKGEQFASFSDKKKNIDYQAKINVAGLNSSKIKNRGIETRVGEALVTETNDLVKIFNPGAKEFSSPKQLANAGSVGSAAGTVFESAIRSAFQGEASGPESQTGRIDFPAPSAALRDFFYNAPGPYEAKINDSLPNRSSALSKWVAVNNLAGGFLPKGLVFSKSKKDEFGFEGISAKKDGKKVGSIEYFEDLPGVVETGSFSVDKRFRGMGIGRSLYQEMLKRNAGKKITGQLLPQTGRFLEKLKRGEKVSAETLYPQMFRAGLGKDSVFEVYGHKGMDVEKMSRQQFTSFVNAKIKELQNDPRKFKRFFGDIDEDPGSGLGVKLDTQHSAGFVPNFADQIRRNIYDWDGTIIPKISGNAEEYIGKLSSLRERDLLPLGKKLKSGNKKFDIFTARPPIFDKAIADTANRLGLPFNKINFGIKPKDKLAEAQNRKSKLIDDDLGLLGKDRFLNARRLNKRLHSGFVPNFGDALSEAIGREKSAGLSSSQIYVDKHSSLKNKDNPMGLMVANRRDEPSGGMQGIRRAKREGIDPKKYGAASGGFVPNFANGSEDNSGAGFAAAIAGLQGLAFTLAFMSQSSRQAKAQILETNKEIELLTRQFDSASSAIPNLEKKLKRAEEVISGQATKRTFVSGREARVGGLSGRAARLESLRSAAEKSGDTSRFVRADDALIKTKNELAREQKKLSSRLRKQSEAASRSVAANNQLIQSNKNLIAANKQAVVARQANLKAQKRELLGGRGFAIGSAAQILAPQLASQIDTSTRGGRGAAQGIESLGNIAGLAGTGAMVAGPWGAIAGGVAGIAIELPKAITALTSIVPDLDQALEKATREQAKFAETSAVALQKSEQLSTLVADPNASAEQILKAEKDYIESINALSEGQRKRLKTAIELGKGGEEQVKIDAELNAAKKRQALLSTVGRERQGIQGALTKTKDFLLGALPAEDFRKAQSIESDRQKGRVLSQDSSKQIVDSLFQAISGGAKIDFGDLGSIDQAGLIEKIKLQLESDGVLDETEQKSLDFLAQVISRPESFKNFISELQSANDKAIDREKALEKIREQTAKRAAEEAAKKMKEAMRASQMEAAFIRFNSSIDRTLNNFIRGFDDAVADMQVVGELKKATGEFNEALLGSSFFNRPQQLLDERSKNQLESINSDFSQSNAKNIQGLASGLDESFKSISGAEFKPGPTVKDADLPAARVEFEAEIQKVRASLFDKSTGIFAPGTVEGLGEEGAAEKIIGKLDEFVAGLGQKEGFQGIAEEVQKFREGAVKKIEDVANSSKEASRETTKQTALLAQQAAFERAQAKIRQSIAFGGQAGLEQQLMFEESSGFNQLTDSLAALSGGLGGRQVGQDELSSSQAGALVEALKNLREYAGLDSLEELPKQFQEAIVASLVKQRKEELRGLESQVKQNPSLAPLIDLIKNQLATVGGIEGTSLSRVLSELGLKDFDQKGQQQVDKILQDSFSALPDDLKNAIAGGVGLGDAFLAKGIEQQTTTLSGNLENLKDAVLGLPNGLSNAVAQAIKNLDQDVKNIPEVKIDASPKVTSNASSKSIERAYDVGLSKAYKKEKSDASSLLGINPSSIQASHGYSKNLISNSNPLGLGVFSPSLGQSSLEDALLDHKGENLKKPKVGTVPNFYSPTNKTNEVARLKAWEERLSAQIESFKDAPYDTPAWEQGLSAIKSREDVRAMVRKLTGEDFRAPFGLEAPKTKTIELPNGGSITVPIADAERFQATTDKLSVESSARTRKKELLNEHRALRAKHERQPGAPRSYYTRMDAIETELRNMVGRGILKTSATNSSVTKPKPPTLPSVNGKPPTLPSAAKSLTKRGDVRAMVRKLTGEKLTSPFGLEPKTKTIQLANGGTITVPIADAERAQGAVDRIDVESSARARKKELLSEHRALKAKYQRQDGSAPRSYYTRMDAIETELRNLVGSGTFPNYASQNSDQALALKGAYEKELVGVRSLLGGNSPISISHGVDSSLVSKSNPSGLGVFSPSVGQSSLRDAIMDHQKPSRNLSIPNFAPESSIDSEKIDNLNSSISELISSISSLSDNSRGATSSSSGGASVNIPINVSVSSAGEGSMPQEYYDSLKSEVESTVSRVNAMYADLIKSRSIAPIAPSRTQSTPIAALGTRG